MGYGLLLSVMVGPAFFILIETSINKGIKSALFFDLGVLIADIVYISIAYMFFSEVTALMESDKSFILKLIGGAFFVFIGMMNILKKRPKASKLSVKRQLNEIRNVNASNLLMTLLKGLTFNLLNPGVLFYWLTLMSILPEAPASMAMTRNDTLFVYIIIILLTFFGLDILKIIGAKKLKEVLTPQWMSNLNLGIGIVLVCFGMLFLTQGLMTYAKLL